MNKKGGYQIIDLKDFNFSEKSYSYTLTSNEGKKFFDNIIGKDKKPLLVSNIVINGVEKNDVIVNDYNIINLGEEWQLIFNMYNYQFTISYQDDIEGGCYFSMIL